MSDTTETPAEETEIEVPEGPKPTNVVEAIAWVSDHIMSVGKGGEAAAAQGGYKYRRIDDVMTAINGVAGSAGLVLVPQVINSKCEIEQSYGSASSTWWRTTLTVRYWVFGPGGVEDRLPEEMSPVVISDSLDNADKGYGKALSYAYKFALSQLFHIPFGDPKFDNEATELPEQNGRQSRGRRGRAAPNHQVEVISRVGADMLIEMLNQLDPDTPRDEVSEIRNRAKYNFSQEFGHPKEVPVERYEDAKAWVTNLLVSKGIEPFDVVTGEKIDVSGIDTDVARKRDVARFSLLFSGDPDNQVAGPSDDAIMEFEAWRHDNDIPDPEAPGTDHESVVESIHKLEEIIENHPAKNGAGEIEPEPTETPETEPAIEDDPAVEDDPDPDPDPDLLGQLAEEETP